MQLSSHRGYDVALRLLSRYFIFIAILTFHSAVAVSIDSVLSDNTRLKPPLLLFASDVSSAVTAVAAAEQYSALGSGSSEIKATLLSAMRGAASPTPSSARSLILNAEPFVLDSSSSADNPTQLALSLRLSGEVWSDLVNASATTTAAPTSTTTSSASNASASTAAPSNASSYSTTRRASWNAVAANIRVEALLSSVPAYLDPYGLDTWVREVLSQREEVDEVSSSLTSAGDTTTVLTGLRYVSFALAGVSSEDANNFTTIPTLLMDLSAAATSATATTAATSSTPTVNDNKCFAPTMDSYLLLRFLAPPATLAGADSTQTSTTSTTTATTSATTQFPNSTTSASSPPNSTTQQTSAAFSEYRGFNARSLYASGERSTHSSAFTQGVPTALLTNTVPVKFLAYGTDDTAETNGVTSVSIVIAAISLCLFAFFNAQFEALLLMWQLQTIMMFGYSSCAPRSIAKLFSDVTWLVWPVNAFGFYSKYNPLLLSSELLLHAVTFVGAVTVILILNFVFANVVLHYARKSIPTATSASPFGTYLPDFGGIGDLLTGRTDGDATTGPNVASGHHSHGPHNHSFGSNAQPNTTGHVMRTRGRSLFNKSGLAVPMLHREGSAGSPHHNHSGDGIEMYTPTQNRSFGQIEDAEPPTYEDDDLFFNSSDDEDDAAVFQDLRFGRTAISDPTANLTPFARARFPSLFLLCSFLLLPGAVFSASKTLSLATNLEEFELPYTTSSSADTVYAGTANARNANYATKAASIIPSLASLTIRDRLMLSDSSYGPDYWLVPEWALILMGVVVLGLAGALIYAAFMIIMRVVTRESFKPDHSYSLPSLSGSLTIYDMLLLKRSGSWVSVDSQYKYGLFYDGLDGSSFWFQFPYIAGLLVVAVVSGQMPLSPQGCTGNAYVHLITTTAVSLLITIRRPYICLSFNILNIIVSVALFFYTIGAVVTTSCGSKGQSFAWTMLWLCLLVILVKAVFVFIAYTLWAYKRRQSQVSRRQKGSQQKGDGEESATTPTGKGGEKSRDVSRLASGLGAFVLPTLTLTGDDKDLDLLPDTLEPYIINPAMYSAAQGASDAVGRAKFRPLLTRQIPTRASAMNPFGAVAAPFMSGYNTSRSLNARNGSSQIADHLSFHMVIPRSEAARALMNIIDALLGGRLLDLTSMANASRLALSRAVDRRPYSIGDYGVGDIKEYLSWLRMLLDALRPAVANAKAQSKSPFGLRVSSPPAANNTEGFRTDLADLGIEVQDPEHEMSTAAPNSLVTDLFEKNVTYVGPHHIAQSGPRNQLTSASMSEDGISLFDGRLSGPVVRSNRSAALRHSTRQSQPELAAALVIEATIACLSSLVSGSAGIMAASANLMKICGFGPDLKVTEGSAKMEVAETSETIKLKQPCSLAVGGNIDDENGSGLSLQPLYIADRSSCRVLVRESLVLSTTDQPKEVGRVTVVASQYEVEEALLSVAPFSTKLNVTGPVLISPARSHSVRSGDSPSRIESPDALAVETLIVDTSLKKVGTVPPVTIHGLCCQGHTIYFTTNAGLFRCDTNNHNLKQNTVMCVSAVLAGGGAMEETVRRDGGHTATRSGEVINHQDYLDVLNTDGRNTKFKEDGDAPLHGYVRQTGDLTDGIMLPTPLLQHPQGLCFDAATNTLFVADPKAGAVFAVPTNTASTKIVVSAPRRSTPQATSLQAVGKAEGNESLPAEPLRAAEPISVMMMPMKIAVCGVPMLQQFFGQTPPTVYEKQEIENINDFYNDKFSVSMPTATRVLEGRIHEYTNSGMSISGHGSIPSMRAPTAVCLGRDGQELFIADTDAHVVWRVQLKSKRQPSPSLQRHTHGGTSGRSSKPHLAGMLFSSQPEMHIAVGSLGKDSDTFGSEPSPNSQQQVSEDMSALGSRSPSPAHDVNSSATSQRPGNKSKIETLKRKLAGATQAIDEPSSHPQDQINVPGPPTAVVTTATPSITSKALLTLLCYPTDVVYVQSSQSLIVVDCGHEGATAVSKDNNGRADRGRRLNTLHCGRVWVVNLSSSSSSEGVARLLLPPTVLGGTKDGYLVPRHVAVLSGGGYIPSMVLPRALAELTPDRVGDRADQNRLSIWAGSAHSYRYTVASNSHAVFSHTDTPNDSPLLSIALSDPVNDVVIKLDLRLTPAAAQLWELERMTQPAHRALAISQPTEQRASLPAELDQHLVQSPMLNANNYGNALPHVEPIDLGEPLSRAVEDIDASEHLEERRQIIEQASQLRRDRSPSPNSGSSPGSIEAHLRSRQELLDRLHDSPSITLPQDRPIAPRQSGAPPEEGDPIMNFINHRRQLLHNLRPSRSLQPSEDPLL